MSDQTPDLPRSTRVIYRAFDVLERLDKKWVALIVLLLILLVYLYQGFYVVGKEEEGVETRFGRVVEENIGPGLHFCFPIIERTYIRSVKRIFRGTLSSKGESGQQFTLLSGDTNLMEISLSVQYQISNLKDFLFKSADPDGILMTVLRSRLIEVLSRFSIDLILTSNRDVIEQELFDSVYAQLNDQALGIELIEVSILDVSPISETVPAFRDVSDAIAEKVRRMSEANTKKERLVAHARGQASAVVRDAKARSEERILKAESATVVFGDLLSEYRKGEAEVLTTRYWARMQSIFSEASLAAINPNELSTIDINMMDSLSVPPGVGVSAATASAGSTRETRPIFSTVRSELHHTIEQDSVEPWLVEGRYHSAPSERDHASFVNARSLMFDHPSMFSHAHIKRTGPVEQALSKQQPVAVKFAEPEVENPPVSVQTPVKEKNTEVENQSASTDP